MHIAQSRGYETVCVLYRVFIFSSVFFWYSMRVYNFSALNICNLHARLMSYSRASVILFFGLFVRTAL